MASRAEVLAYAAEHGAKQAAAHFGIKVGTIWSWKSRAKQRAAQYGTDPPPPSAADRWMDEARAIADRMARGQCVRCGGAHRVQLPEVRRGGLLIRKARTIDCPDCGGPVRRIQVTEWPRQEWREAQARASDAGAGWSAEEWARIRAGELDPFGQRISGGGDG